MSYENILEPCDRPWRLQCFMSIRCLRQGHFRLRQNQAPSAGFGLSATRLDGPWAHKNIWVITRSGRCSYSSTRPSHGKKTCKRLLCALVCVMPRTHGQREGLHRKLGLWGFVVEVSVLNGWTTIPNASESKNGEAQKTMVTGS